MRHLTLITTGGTIEKTYDESTGSLENRRSIMGRMLRRLHLTDTAVHTVELMSKDSQFMTDDDRRVLTDAVRLALLRQPAPNGIVITHGTDTLELTGEHLLKELGALTIPIVLTGAMRPFEMRRSDSVQNLTESLFAAGVLSPGVYCVAHGRALKFPGVVKDREKGTFIHAPHPA